MSRLWHNALVVPFVLLSGGCAIHYFDSETGTEHIWGFGHMQMKVSPPNEGVQAVVRGTDVLGLSIGSADQQVYFTAGWHRVQRLDVIAESTAVRLEWPSADFAEVRVGTAFPGVPGSAWVNAKPVESTTEIEPKEEEG
ncbi:MAG: hypothetical protein V3T84_07265 [Phycisphaerales bacterium]